MFPLDNVTRSCFLSNLTIWFLFGVFRPLKCSLIFSRVSFKSTIKVIITRTLFDWDIQNMSGLYSDFPCFLSFIWAFRTWTSFFTSKLPEFLILVLYQKQSLLFQIKVMHAFFPLEYFLHGITRLILPDRILDNIK